MAIKLKSATNDGFVVDIIEVEVDILKGMPSFTIVGLPDTAVKESKERVKSAIINSGYEFPLGKIVINLAPADIRKVGSVLDLPIALGILMESNQIKRRDLEDYIIFGELSLNAEIKPVKAALLFILKGVDEDIDNIILPYDNIRECMYCSKAKYYPFISLNECVSYINFNDRLPSKINEYEQDENDEDLYDFSNIIGQETSKRAIMIAAAGNHNIILYGSTGVGKSMLAKALPSILPKLSMEEELEIVKIYSATGLLGDKRISRPFRSPHHTITYSGLVGGGKNIKPGEITLAHKGVLYLDEILEFKKNVLEGLREPLEEGKIEICRNNNSISLPSDFIFIAATNLCPCGKYDLNNNNGCNCNLSEINRYVSKMSKALRDRIDMFNYVPMVNYNQINNKERMPESKKMKEEVIRAREKQKERLKYTKYMYNSQIKGKDIFELCRINKKVEIILSQYFVNSKPSLRSYGKVVKVARTIADIEGLNDIDESCILEALEYRKDIDGKVI